MGRYFEFFLSRWGSRILLFASPLFALFKSLSDAPALPGFDAAKAQGGRHPTPK